MYPLGYVQKTWRTQTHEKAQERWGMLKRARKSNNS